MKTLSVLTSGFPWYYEKQKIYGLRQYSQSQMAGFARVEERMQIHSAQFKHIVLDLSPVLKEKQEVLQGSLLFLDMVDDVKILYDRGNFLARYLVRLRERLQQLGARKTCRGGAWYWVLKKDYRQGEVIEI